jgi:hypothetical protein
MRRSNCGYPFRRRPRQDDGGVLPPLVRPRRKTYDTAARRGDSTEDAVPGMSENKVRLDRERTNLGIDNPLLEAMLGTRVDLVSANDLKPEVRPRAAHDLVAL